MAGELFERFERVMERLRRAEAEAGRPRGVVALTAVSKYHPASAVADLARYWAERAEADPAYGVPCFGENYVQEALAKMAEVDDFLAANLPVRRPVWHFTGHLQSRKAKECAGRFALIQTLDSLKLAQNLQKTWRADVAERPRGLDDPAPAPQSVLVQVNIAAEPQKSGVAPEDVEEHQPGIAAMPELEARGLMCLPPMTDNAEDARPYFRRLFELRNDMRQKTGLQLPVLSMGMSQDFHVAVAEGADLVRVGTDIFGPRASGGVEA